MRVLAVDTSTDLGSVALLDEQAVLAEVTARVRARHGETLLAQVAHVLEVSGVDKRSLDLFAVGLGPGSFTGTRIGMATAKGLSLALDRPLIGVGSLVAIAGAAPSDRVTVAVDGHKGQVFLASYQRAGERMIETAEPLDLSPEAAVSRILEAPSATVCGSAARAYPERFAQPLVVAGRRVLPAAWDAPRASMVALEALARWSEQGADDRASLEPRYVRDSDAVLPTDS